MSDSGAVPDRFRAYVVDHDSGSGVRDLHTDELGEGDVLIRVQYSSVNFKDSLAARADGKVARISPLIPGIDLAGVVVDGGDRFRAGEEVLAHGYGLGVSHHGGYSEYARVPADWVVRIPATLTARQAMSLGTAGFTAARSVSALEAHGASPEAGPVLVTGASGGVGSVAVAILAHRGYEVVASTGKSEAAERLTSLGAARVLDRSATTQAAKPLQREEWGAAVDCVGGDTLAYVLSTLRYGAAVAASGNTGGVALNSTVFPFILRGVSLLGIDSVQVPLTERQDLWDRIALDLRPNGIDDLATAEVGLDRVPQALESIGQGRSSGRTLVALD